MSFSLQVLILFGSFPINDKLQYIKNTIDVNIGDIQMNCTQR